MKTPPLPFRLLRAATLQAAILLPLGAAAKESGGKDSTPKGSQVEWFATRLKGGEAAFAGDRTLTAKAVSAARQALWADYKAAAVQLGWDREIGPVNDIPKLPPLEEFRKLPPEKRPKIPEFKATLMPCDGETMPYLLLRRGKRPDCGFPLFFQTHGGGSTDEKLSGPHGWPVNTRDWQNQVGLCMFQFPQGLYCVPRMANDNKGRWWMKHNHTAFDRIIRRAILFRDVDPDRIYMMGISEGAYGTEALTPFWADRFAGGCAMAGGAGGGERLRNLRNTAFRNDTGENDTMFGRIGLARQAHEVLANLKKSDPQGYDHILNIQPGKGHGIDYAPGPAWLATKRRNPRPAKLCWFNFALDGVRRTEFSWLALATAPPRDTLVTAEADRAANTLTVTALINPPETKDESPVYNTATPPPVENRIPYTGNTLVLRLDDKLLDLDRPVVVTVNGKEAFRGKVERKLAHMADDIVRCGDPGRVFPARVSISL